MIGETHGRLTVLAFDHYSGKHRRHYLCECACGGRKVVQATLLRNGNTRSCGCLATESRRGQRLPDNAGVVNQIILQYRRHARDRNIPYHLERDQVDALVRRPCHYCGDPAGNLKRTKNCPEGFAHNGIDRLNASKAYETGNVVPCCGTCNIAKGTRSHQEFIEWAARIAEHTRTMADQWGGDAERRAA